MAKTKALITFAVTCTAKLIYAFVFANAVCWFSDEAAKMPEYFDVFVWFVVVLNFLIFSVSFSNDALHTYMYFITCRLLSTLPAYCLAVVLVLCPLHASFESVNPGYKMSTV